MNDEKLRVDALIADANRKTREKLGPASVRGVKLPRAKPVKGGVEQCGVCTSTKNLKGRICIPCREALAICEACSHPEETHVNYDGDAPKGQDGLVLGKCWVPQCDCKLYIAPETMHETIHPPDSFGVGC